ncbi:putative transposase, Ptta/En/Spm, plant [Senna tora]|uniref:Putative transposase, Ptta/En/Spm, plant n=1 Tax=Senna tora TaxID=362788 RepID=A0A834TML3_9FABA|nr:putative transposase, Ptta/En/Spm, plant [Senna tora]
MRPDRSWILRRKEPSGRVSEEFMDGVDEFLKLVNEFPINKDSLGRILYPCGRCKNCVRKDEYTIERHLYYNGFVESYLNWTIHGENAWGGEGSAFNDADDEEDTRNRYVDMVVDVARGRLDHNFELSGSRVNGEWWAACKVRAKLFKDETLNSVGEVSNELSTFDYYQDDESLTIHDRTSEEEEINLLDAHGLMEEVNVDELPNPMNAPHTDQFIDDDEETDHNEFLDSDEELFDSDSSRSPLVTTPSASASPIDANNSRDLTSPSPELPGASTGHILDSVESTVPHARVDRRKAITVEENGMPFAAERWRDYSVEVKEELFKEFMDKYRFQSDNDRKMARDVWEKTCSDRYSDILTKHRVKILDDLKTRDMAKLKGHGPAGIRAEVWDGLVDIWLTPEWQKKSEAAKRSRATAPDAMLHTGGSISFGAHKKKMEAEQNQKVSWRDVYHKTHKKKNGEFVFERSKHFTENLDIALSDKYGEKSSSYLEVDANLWLDVAPHSKK